MKHMRVLTNKQPDASARYPQATNSTPVPPGAMTRRILHHAEHDSSMANEERGLNRQRARIAARTSPPRGADGAPSTFAGGDRLAGTTSSPIQPGQLLDVGQAADILGMGKSFVYIECERGRLPHLKLGRRVKIPRTALDAYIDNALQTRSSDIARWRDRGW